MRALHHRCATARLRGFCHPGDCRAEPGRHGFDAGRPVHGRPVRLPLLEPDVLGARRVGNGRCQALNCTAAEPLVALVRSAMLRRTLRPADPRQCFVNPTIQRAGNTAGYVPITNQDRTTGSIFCISSTTLAVREQRRRLARSGRHHPARDHDRGRLLASPRSHSRVLLTKGRQPSRLPALRALGRIDSAEVRW